MFYLQTVKHIASTCLPRDVEQMAYHTSCLGALYKPY